MSCHGNNKNHKKSPLKHMLHMVLCCGLPIVIIGFLPFITKLSPSAGSLIGKVIPFLCPIMMIGMMIAMGKGSKEKSCCHDPKGKDKNKNKEVV